MSKRRQRRPALSESVKLKVERNQVLSDRIRQIVEAHAGGYLKKLNAWRDQVAEQYASETGFKFEDARSIIVEAEQKAREERLERMAKQAELERKERARREALARENAISLLENAKEPALVRGEDE